MARKTTLTELLRQYRAECRFSLAVEHNVQAAQQQIMHLQRTQEWLWDDFDWPFLRVTRTFDVQAGQRFYGPPEDIKVDRIEKLDAYWGGGYVPLHAGIDSAHYSTFDPTLDQRDWPPRRWQIAEDDEQDIEQIEIWPLPGQNADATTHEGRITVHGIRNLKPLVALSDHADLDDRLIVLFAASEVLASRGDKNAPVVQQAANKRYLKLRGDQMKRKRHKLFGVGSRFERRPERVPLAIYNKVT